MSEDYYIRIRGTVKGPLSREQIVTQIRRKRLGRHHELSVDSVHWEKAGDMPDLFKPLATANAGNGFDTTDSADADEAAEQLNAHSENGGQSSASNSISDVAPVQAEWFYAQDGKQSGPVSEADIRRMVSTGQLTSSDLIWSEGFEKWTPAGETAGFATAFVQAPSKPQSPQESGFLQEERKAGFWEAFMGTSQGAVLPSKAHRKFPNLTRYLRMSESSLRILFVLFLFVFLAGWLYRIGEAVSTEDWLMVGIGLVAGPLAVLILWLAFTSALAGLELIRVLIKIEDNTSKA